MCLFEADATGIKPGLLCGAYVIKRKETVTLGGGTSVGRPASIGAVPSICLIALRNAPRPLREATGNVRRESCNGDTENVTEVWKAPLGRNTTEGPCVALILRPMGRIDRAPLFSSVKVAVEPTVPMDEAIIVTIE